jgi:hypothetical protein
MLMEKNTIESLDLPIIEHGLFRIKLDDIVILDVLSVYHNLRENFKFIPKDDLSESRTISDLVKEMRANGIRITDGVLDLISKNSFVNTFEDFRFNSGYGSIAIIKGRAINSRSPKSVIDRGLPPCLEPLSSKNTFHFAYLISHFLTQQFINIHNIYNILIMSDPFNDGKDLIQWTPALGDEPILSAALYDNPYTGSKNMGFLFKYV